MSEGVLKLFVIVVENIDVRTSMVTFSLLPFDFILPDDLWFYFAFLDIAGQMLLSL